MKLSSLAVGLIAGLLLTVVTATAHAHCQIPCGIYGDSARFVEMREHLTTIEKSMKEISRLSAMDKPDQNQLVRWVMNKEDHADKMDEIITFYFMAQRVKPADPKDKKAHAAYVAKIETLHRMLVQVMKTRQGTDTKTVDTLRSLVDTFEHQYNH